MIAPTFGRGVPLSKIKSKLHVKQERYSRFTNLTYDRMHTAGSAKNSDDGIKITEPCVHVVVGEVCEYIETFIFDTT
jgi:hypothetical protein